MYRLKTFAITLALACAAYGAEGQPFPIGEAVTYTFAWNGIPVGNAKAKIFDVAGKPQIRLQASGGTNAVIDKLYRLRFMASSIVWAADMKPVRYILVQREGKRHVNWTLTYNPDAGEFKSVKQKMHKNGRKTEYTIKSRKAFDIIGGFYAFRLLKVAPGQTKVVQIADGKGLYHVTVRAGQPKIVATSAGKFQTVPLTVKTKRVHPPDKPDKKRPVATVWVSNDTRRLPVKMAAKTKWGTISAKLVSASPKLRTGPTTTAKK